MAILRKLPIVHSPIQRLHETFVIAGLTNSYIAPHEIKNISYEQLLVVLDVKDYEDEIVCQMVFADDIYDDLMMQLEENALPQNPILSIPMLQFMVHLPLKTTSETHSATCNFIGFLNQLLPFGFFLADKKEGLYFRYIWSVHDQFVDQKVAMEITQKISYFIGKFMPLLSQVSTGQSSAKEAIEILSKGSNN